MCVCVCERERERRGGGGGEGELEFVIELRKLLKTILKTKDDSLERHTCRPTETQMIDSSVRQQHSMKVCSTHFRRARQSHCNAEQLMFKSSITTRINAGLSKLACFPVHSLSNDPDRNLCFKQTFGACACL